VNEPVVLPFWLAFVVVALAAWLVGEKLLLPAVRRFGRGRINRVLEEASSRLRISVRPFQRTRRQVLIHRLLGDPKVMAARESYAAEKKLPLPAVLATIEGYAREIVPAFNAYMVFRHQQLARAQGLARPVPVRPRLRRHRRAGAGARERDGRVRHEPPLEHGLHPGEPHRGRPGGAVVRGRRVGADLAAVAA
jgi:hypothetical protein